MAPASELPFLDALASPSAAPGAGAAAARVGALAAALIEMGCGRAGPGSRAHALREYFARKSQESRAATCEIPLQIAELASRLPRLAREVQLVGNPKAAADLRTAVRFAESARAAAADLVRANLPELRETGQRAGFLERLAALD
jgi:formiminotetrahydrofolate cyclodeaminase